jgi:hypothetical protein
MQGNCYSVETPSASFPSGHAPLRPLLPNQCLLLADEDLLNVRAGNLWLDSLYVRLTTPRDAGGVFYGFIQVGFEAAVWMTGVTLQGNGDGVEDCWACGLIFWAKARVYAEGAASAFSLTGSAFLHCASNRQHACKYGPAGMPVSYRACMLVMRGRIWGCSA